MTDKHLKDLINTHSHVLHPLLGHLWPVHPFKVEKFGPLTKYTLGQMPDGSWAMLHRIKGPDQGPPHDHPCVMVSHIIKGAYTERIWRPSQVHAAAWESSEMVRQSGDVHTILPETVHLLTAVSGGECWTLVFAGPVVRKWRHYPELEKLAPTARVRKKKPLKQGAL